MKELKLNFLMDIRGWVEIKIFKYISLCPQYISIFEGLDAFSIYNIPIYWLGVSFLSTIYLICYFLGFRTFNLNLISIRNWVIYGVFVTLIQSFFNDLILPKYASTSYIQYIGLRLFKLFLFLIVIYLINYILQKYDFEKILKFILIFTEATSQIRN